MMKLIEIFLVSCMVCLRFGRSNYTNYISNGSFDLPMIPNYPGWLIGVATGWQGQYFDLINDVWAGHGQALDMQRGPGQNGYLQQTVLLPNSSFCNLTFYQQAMNTNYNSFVLQIYWNGELMATQKTNTTLATHHTVVLCGRKGNNSLRFQQIGTDGDYFGMIIDQISLTCDGVSKCLFQDPDPILNGTNSTNLKEVVQPVPEQTVSAVISGLQILASVVFSMPLNQAAGLRNVYIFAEDLWLYNYDKVQYEGVMSIAFNVTALIQSIKFNIFESALHLGRYGDTMLISNYKPYTKPKFVQVDGTSWVLIRAAFPFFVYTIPENILIGFVLYFLFNILSKYKISQWIRKFYFFKTSFLQTLFEGNVAYFAYVCFGHLSTSFSFRFFDKMSLVLTVFFLWAVTMFCFIHYPLVGQFLKQKAGYFLLHVYRCNSGHFFMGVKNLVRNYVRAAIFFFLHEHYPEQLILLSLVEIIIVLLIFLLEAMKGIFISKFFYFEWLAYHCLFILLNMSLYFSYLCDTVYSDLARKQTALLTQTVVLYMLIGCSLIIFITNFLPIDCLRRNSSSSEAFEDRISLQKKQNKKDVLKIEDLKTEKSQSAIIVLDKAKSSKRILCKKKTDQNELLVIQVLSKQSKNKVNFQAKLKDEQNKLTKKLIKSDKNNVMSAIGNASSKKGGIFMDSKSVKYF